MKWKKIAKEHDKTIAQVAINWLITTKEDNVIPIPGMRKVSQVQNNVGATNWMLTDEERNRINKIEEETR